MKEKLHEKSSFVGETTRFFAVLDITETTYTQYSERSLYANQESKLWTFYITSVIEKVDSNLSKLVLWRLPTRVLLFKTFI